MTNEFANPPLESATCEFRFMPSEAWDMTLPGLVWERVKERYPERRQDTRFGTEISQRSEGLEHKVTKTDWLTMYRSDVDASIQVSRDRLLVTRGRPYPSWAVFRQEIQYALVSYDSAHPPKALARVGLRYVNKLTIPRETIELEDYLEFYPASGKGFPDSFASFVAIAVYPYDNQEAFLRVQLSPAPPPDEQSTSLVLDLDYFTAKPPEYDLAGCADWLEAAHARIEDAFLAATKPSLRAFFE